MLPIEIVAMILCFGGMVTLTLSGTKNADDAAEISEDDGKHTYSNESLMLGYSLIFLVSWIYASNCVLNRSLKTVHHAIILFWHGVLGITLALTWACVDYFVKP